MKNFLSPLYKLCLPILLVVSMFTYGQQLSAKINGKDFTAVQGTDFNAVYGILTKTPMFFQLSISAMTIQDGIAKSIVITIMSEKSFNTVSANTVWDSKNTSLDDLPMGIYYEKIDFDDVSVEASSEITENTYLKITHIDKTKQIVSGEFNFTATDGKNTYTITNGVFTNVSFKK
ncbi:hypothetical protein [Yeosuana sp. AK3]